MKLKLAYYGNPILRKKAALVASVTPEIKQLVADMEVAMAAHDGIGLAAPQVSRSLAIFIINVPKEVEGKEDEDKWIPGETRVFINPKIIEYSEESWIRGEGCLSIPGVYGTVLRPMDITVQAMGVDGNSFTESFSGLEARAIMHENDHLNGVLFIDRVRGKEKKEVEQDLKELKKKLLKKLT